MTRRMAMLLLLMCAAAAPTVTMPAEAFGFPGVPLYGGADLAKCLAVVVNQSNLTENLSFAELRKIFRGERNHWPGGHRITLVIQEPGQAERAAVLRDVYQMSESDFNRYFAQATFTGEVFSAPKTLATSTGVRKFIFNVPGAIGFVRADEVDQTVKVLRIDGLLPGDKGYRLRLEAR